ncbi:flagellar basal body P-ring formation chaperone FlgA [Thalassotalea sediminis]|uniref:flagellar basal body P-ring formation chaperone FlgA n=1 Tax=Thalassotalea sediminis TaxID=1759089 RepID=UPI0025726CD1|nr:flagellar basal body P-ring formation chaperone FlgA [Thalassotalea sediminis]
MSKLKIFITFSIFSSLLLSTLNAKEFTREEIKLFAKNYVAQHLPTSQGSKRVITPADIDPRIHIKPCSVPLQANIPENYSTRNVNVKIYCESSTPWNIFLPVRVAEEIPVLVAKIKIAKGTVLDESNVAIEWRPLHQTRGEIIRDPAIVHGARSRRSLTSGAVITRRMFCVVCKGENVVISAITDNLTIKTKGTALANGVRGQQIRVRNNRSGRVITAEVKTINQVVINL